MHWKNVDFPTALHDLSSRLGLSSSVGKKTSPLSLGGRGAGGEGSSPSLEWQSRAQTFIDYAHTQLLHPQISAPARAFLFAERGLKPETWEVFHLGYNPADLYDNPLSWGLSDTPSLQGRGKGIGKIFLPRGIVIPGLSNGLPYYVKIRRPLPGDLLSEYLPLNENGRPKEVHSHSKFLSIRGSRPILFGSDLWLGQTILLLVEGEFDSILAWQHASDLCDDGVYFDAATLGSASNRAALPDLAALTRYPAGCTQPQSSTSTPPGPLAR